ncbi:argininosuccinate synthase domain-containing protein, partial [Rhodopirellula baltica]|uniref:argininosuccinate synthase domain-containing protein n=1 Tax=Rhodopirellula baltica TaxID=265606 RepID=UPI0028F425FB
MLLDFPARILLTVLACFAPDNLNARPSNIADSPAFGCRSEMKSCVLAYSGGLDTSVILGWLQDQGYEVHCVYVDLGQPCE